MLDWWRDWYHDLIVVCRSEHFDLLPDDVRRVACDVGGGPARALAAALPLCDEGPITVIYADTWVSHVPGWPEFCGVGVAEGGRNWDVIEDGLCASRSVGEDEVAMVAIGLYRFAEKWRLALALTHELSINPDGEVGLADVVNDLDLPFKPVLGWQDVGTVDSLHAWRGAA